MIGHVYYQVKMAEKIITNEGTLNINNDETPVELFA